MAEKPRKKSTQADRTMKVEEVKNMMLLGQSRKEIVQSLTEKYKVKDRAVDLWLADARPLAEEAQAVRNSAIQAVRSAELIKAAESDIKSDLEVESILCQIIEGTHRLPKTFVTADGVPIEVMSPPEHGDVLRAADILFKKRGSYAAVKQKVELTKGWDGFELGKEDENPA